MRCPTTACLIALLLMPLAAVSVAAAPQALSAPHVVIILADDLGPGDLGSAGATRGKAPNIDRLTLPAMLRRAGYRTGVVGKWHLGLGDGRTRAAGSLRPVKPTIHLWRRFDNPNWGQQAS